MILKDLSYLDNPYSETKYFYDLLSINAFKTKGRNIKWNL